MMIMLKEEEIENLLRKTLPEVSDSDIRRVARTLRDAAGQWKEVDLSETLGAQYSVQCRDICALGMAHFKGQRIRAFILEE